MKMQLLWAEFRCPSCNKPVLSHKSIVIAGKRYHMLCGLSEAKRQGIIEKARE